MSIVPIRYAPDEDEPDYSLEFLHPRYNPRRYRLPHYQTLSQFVKCRQSLRPSSKDALSVQHTSKDGFRVNLDVEQFDPNEITVRTVGNQIIVEARDYAKVEGGGLLKRRFVGRYNLPKEFDVKDLISTLTPNGVLTLKAPPKRKSFESVSWKDSEFFRLIQNKQEQKEIKEYELDEDERG